MTAPPPAEGMEGMAWGVVGIRLNKGDHSGGVVALAAVRRSLPDKDHCRTKAGDHCRTKVSP
ncbi:hypothetical protein [Streptomyces sp. 2A115]|uniref:hypothetical protein n=1 Tax=Streptomyces sp. 2A115 TaxID=3457439 RepID=UPI003FD17B65